MANRTAPSGGSEQSSGKLGSGADLELVVQERPDSLGRIFDVRLRVSLQWMSSLQHATYGEISFKADPADLFRQHLNEIGEASPKTDDQKAAFAKTLRAEGAYFSGQILPAEIRKCLASLQEQATTLHVVSEAPWIPWELLRIESNPASPGIDGPFLCEAFAVTRGMPGLILPESFPLSRIGVVIPHNQKLRRGQQLSSLEGEWQDLQTLIHPGIREVERIEARIVPIIEAFSQGENDGWHFSSHALFKDFAPDLSEIVMEAKEVLRPAHLAGEAVALGKRHPLVFLNACSSGQTGLSLTSVGGWAAHFLAAGAGAYIGALWPIYDSRARQFAAAFYSELLAGKTIGEAVQKARVSIKSPDNPTWLAYTVFANPMARCKTGEDRPAVIPPTRLDDGPLMLPQFNWNPSLSPGTLLRADYGIVRFHGREKELAELRSWCQEDAPVRVRLYTGPGGMGKTRLALQIASELRASGWQAGFLSPDPAVPPHEVWKVLSRRGGRMLLIVDYAETRRDLLVSILKEIRQAEEGPIRVILLARAALDWWEQLKTEGDGVGEILGGPATTKCPLTPLALSVPQREESFSYAMKDFAETLSRPLPAAKLEDAAQEFYERALLLHMSALATIEGVIVKGEQGILDFVLARERRHWRDRAVSTGIAKTLVPGIGRAMAAITLAGGVPSEQSAVAVFRALRFFKDQTEDVLVSIGHMLRESYPGARDWIEPILPDLLGEHLIQKEMENGAQEILDLVLGPASPPGT